MHSLRPYLYYLMLFLLFLSNKALATTIEETEIQKAKTVIEILQTRLIESMQAGDTWSKEKRYEYFEPIIKNNFDIEIISRVVLGRHWKPLSDEDKSSFIDLIQKLTITNFAHQFDTYANEQFKTRNVKTRKKQRLLVKTELTTADNNLHNLDYLLHKVNDRWMIISITADGVNELSLRRAEYTGILKKQGFEALKQQINDQITRLNTQ